jgi:hypothetical protein
VLDCSLAVGPREPCGALLLFYTCCARYTSNNRYGQPNRRGAGHDQRDVRQERHRGKTVFRVISATIARATQHRRITSPPMPSFHRHPDNIQEVVV